MSTPDFNLYGLMMCPDCKGTGYTTNDDRQETGKALAGTLPCLRCQRTGSFLSWWPDAFVSDLVLRGPILQSTVNTLDSDRDPQHIRWANGAVAWKHITHLTQFTATPYMHCRMPDSISANGKPMTYIHRHLPNGLTIETTKVHLPNDYLIVGLPYPLVLQAWLKHLTQR